MPSDVDDGVVEQRILEQGTRLRRWGAVSGWASLRWHGGAYFDGTTHESQRLEVPLVVGAHRLRNGPGFDVSREQLAPSERELVDGLWVTTVQRALFDEVRRCRGLRSAVVAIEKATAAQLISVWLFAAYVANRNSWTGAPFVRSVLPWAIDESRSPMETLMRLCWQIDAGLPPPLCNRPIYDAMDGSLLGIPDLLDPVAGLVGEYDGVHHRSSEQHRDDVERETGFRDHGLEYFTVVGGEVAHRRRIATRMLQARARAKFLPPESCAWTLTPPPWVAPQETLDQFFERRGMVDLLTHS